MSRRKQQKEFEAAPVVIVTRCVPNFIAWMYFVTFWFDGEPFDYLFEIGPVSMAEDAAQAVVDRSDFFQRAQRNFLREVHLGSEFNDTELLPA